MRRQISLALAGMVLIAAAAPASNPCGGGRNASEPLELRNTPGLVTVWSPRKSSENATHTYVITHGLSGLEFRFFDLGRAILLKNPDVQVLVVEWDPAKKERIGTYGNPWAAAKRIDPTGDALGEVLVSLHKQKVIDLTRTTFIGESFGNYVNHRAVMACRKAGHGKVHGAVILNPASELGGYQPPLMRDEYVHSAAFVSDSILDTRKPIADSSINLKTTSTDPFVQHTFGLEWLRTQVTEGASINDLIATKPTAVSRCGTR